MADPYDAFSLTPPPDAAPGASPYGTAPDPYAAFSVTRPTDEMLPSERFAEDFATDWTPKRTGVFSSVNPAEAEWGAPPGLSVREQRDYLAAQLQAARENALPAMGAAALGTPAVIGGVRAWPYVAPVAKTAAKIAGAGALGYEGYEAFKHDPKELLREIAKDYLFARFIRGH